MGPHLLSPGSPLYFPGFLVLACNCFLVQTRSLCNLPVKITQLINKVALKLILDIYTFINAMCSCGKEQYRIDAIQLIRVC